MTAKIRSQTWRWQFDSPVEAIWPILADTARFNEAADLPKHEIDEQAQPDGSVRYLGRMGVGPISIEWEEKPVNWVHNQWFEHCRYFRNGPLDFLCATLRLVPQGDGCCCEYTVKVAARNLLGRILISTVFFAQVGRTFTPLAESARDFAKGARATEFDCKAPALAPGASRRVTLLAAKMEQTPHGHGLARKLADYVLTRQEVDVWAIRPLKLARLWKVPERHAVEVCLEAVKQGLLGLRWDLLCPRCQVTKASLPALDQLPTGAHCGSCNIDYDREFSKNVELAFFPAQAIRPIENGEYCLFGPLSTPHIKLHLTVRAGERRGVNIDLPHGSYRLRTLEPGGEEIVEWQRGGFPSIIADGADVQARPAAGEGEIVMHNQSARALTFIVEERVWARDAFTADRAIALQAFRDLFTEDVLRPGDDVGIEHVALMFTDLKGSTALYERIGDPQAYALVREHYAVIGKAVRESNGAIVKTIGDAIMGVFSNPSDALECAVRLHGDFTIFNASSGREPIMIKIGLHLGRCISVTLNERLDYYGTAANKAARLQGESRGGDIVLSEEFAKEPTVRPVLAQYSIDEEWAELKGFDVPVRFYRISPGQLTI